MCLIDYKIGTLIRTTTRHIILPITETVIAPANKDRVMLRIYAGISGNNFFVSTETGITTTNGILVNGTVYPVEVWLARDGDLVQKQWVGLSAVASRTMIVIEGFLPDSYLRTMLEEFEQGDK